MAAAGAIVYDDQGRILLQKRTDFDEWAPPGGGLDLGETLAECAIREVFEETGMHVEITGLISIYSEPKFDVLYPNGDETQQFTVKFAARVIGGELTLDEDETSELRWFEPEEIPYGKMRPWFDQMFRDAASESLPVMHPPVSLPERREMWRVVRPMVGTAQIIAPGVMVMVTRAEDDCVLIIQRSDSLGWWPITGFTDLGENLTHTAIREVREEVGLEVEIERILGVYSAEYLVHTFENGDEVKNVGVAYRARVVGGELDLDSAEVHDAKWMTHDELRAAAANYFNYPLIDNALKHLNSGVFIA